MDIKEFAQDWVKKKYPNDYLTIVCDPVLELAEAWAEKQAVNFVMWNEHALERDRETYDETYQDWLTDLEERRIIKDSESETQPSEQ